MATKKVSNVDHDSQRLRANEKKWTKPLMDAGWTVFPSIILEKQETLGLQPLDINIILHLAMYWWEATNRPHPSKATIAKAVGVHSRTVQKRIAALEKLGYLRREFRPDPVKGNKSNVYHLDGLIEEVTPFALEKIQLKERTQEEEKQRIARKSKPKLSAVKGGKDL